MNRQPVNPHLMRSLTEFGGSEVFRLKLNRVLIGSSPTLARKLHHFRLSSGQIGSAALDSINGGKKMNWETIEGKWKQVKGQAREKWGKLTDDELDQIDGKREQLIGKVQEKYAIAREKAEQEVKEFQSSFGD